MGYGIEPQGKLCPKCGEGMSNLSTMNHRLCSACGYLEPWNLDDKQLPTVSSNRATRRTQHAPQQKTT